VANTIKLSIKVDDDGSLAIVGREAKEAAKNLEGVSKAADRTGSSAKGADRNMKGLSKQSANTTKNFSKMQQGMTGGLVPAYAILASNVFALSAAFQFFKRAADLSNLESSQISFAENTGVALGSITQRLREASSGMLGFREASQAAAIGMAKGFSPSQLEDLAQGAKKASTALGRDFEDAFDRLIRGASKAEPELLDELGITLRLEDATRKYAESIGKTSKQLNTYQRSQAVLIETQRQLDKNFGAMDAAVNPFIRLSKTFDDIIKKVTEFFLPMFNGIANLLSGSATSAIAAFGLLGASIFKTILPMEDLNTKLTDFSNNATAGFRQAIQDVRDFSDEVAVAAADVAATKAGGAQDYQKAAASAVEQGAKSPSLIRAAAGEATPQDNARIKTAVAAFEKNAKKGMLKVGSMFEKVSANIVADIGGAMNRMNAKSTTTFGKMKKTAILWGKRTKVVFKGVAASGKLMFVGLAKGAKLAGRAMDSAMKLAGIIGILKLVYDAFQGIISAPLTISMGVAKMADSISDILAPLLNGIAVGFLGIADSVLDSFEEMRAGIAKAVNLIATIFKTAFDAMIISGQSLVNIIIEGINAVNPLKKIKPIPLIEFSTVELMDEAVGAASNLANNYEGITSGGRRFEKMMKNSSIGAYFAAVESGADAVKASGAALKAFKASAAAAEKSLGGILLGMEQTENATEASEKAFNGLVSLDIAGLFKNINAEQKVWNKTTKQFDTKGIMTEADRARAIETLTSSMEGLLEVSPLYAAALAKALKGDAGPLNALAKNITDTNVQLSAFTEGLTSTKSAVKDSLAGGNMREGITALMQLKEAGEDAGKGIERTTLQKGKLEALRKEFEEMFGTGTDANELLNTLIGIQKETDSIALTQTMSQGIQGETKVILQEELAVRTVINEIARVNVQLSQAANATDTANYEQKLRILAVEKAITEQARLRRLSSEVGKMKNVGSGKTAAGLMQNTLNKQTQRDIISSSASQIINDPLMQLNDPEKYKSLTASISAASEALKTLKEQTAEGIFKNMAEDFAALGPEGELLSQVSAGMGNMITATKLMGEAGEDSAKRMAAGFQVASAVLSSVSGIMNAAHKNRVAGIDSEIKAEQKRDGKSKESLARIKSLEKKKEDMARKNFEMNKKMQMANVIVSTAAAVAQLYANPIDPTKLWASMMMPMIIGMGAAQLAMISGTSFQGGGSTSAGAGVPSSVSVGSRGKGSDLSKSQSARGELAYFRGGEGTGGAENFRSAFYGSKHRASGGNTGYVVGEQGPELFMPDRPGTIVPADDFAAGGAGANVTFSINAIDAAGVEDVLVQQQGNIIGMLREAANSYGENFMEDLDESTYTTPVARRA